MTLFISGDITSAEVWFNQVESVFGAPSWGRGGYTKSLAISDFSNRNWESLRQGLRFIYGEVQSFNLEGWMLEIQKISAGVYSESLPSVQFVDNTTVDNVVVSVSQPKSSVFTAQDLAPLDTFGMDFAPKPQPISVSSSILPIILIGGALLLFSK